MLGQVRFEKKSQFWFGKKKFWLGQVWNKKLSWVKLGLKKKLHQVGIGQEKKITLDKVRFGTKVGLGQVNKKASLGQV